MGQVAAFASAVGLDHPYWQGDAPCSLLIGEIEALWARIAEADDWSLLDAKLAQIERFTEAMPA